MRRGFSKEDFLEAVILELGKEMSQLAGLGHGAVGGEGQIPAEGLSTAIWASLRRLRGAECEVGIGEGCLACRDRAEHCFLGYKCVQRRGSSTHSRFLSHPSDLEAEDKGGPCWLPHQQLSQAKPLREACGNQRMFLSPQHLCGCHSCVPAPGLLSGGTEWKQEQ